MMGYKSNHSENSKEVDYLYSTEKLNTWNSHWLRIWL